MQQKNGTGKLVGGILCAMLAFFNFIPALICLLMGFIYGANPAEVDITINGEKLYGAEAVDAALKLSAIFKTIGTVTLIIGALCVILAVVFIVGYSKIMKENAK